MNHKLISLLLILTVVICMIVAACPSAAAQDDASDPPADNASTLAVPQIRVTTEEGNGLSLQKADGYVNAVISITDTDGTALQDSVQFKVRGNTTAMTTILKKAYTFKFSKKKNVLGLGSGKKWALLANAFDPTMLRNAVANTIAHELSLDYTSNRRYVELWVDDSYRGCYEVYEPVEEGTDRVEIDIKSNNGMKDFMLEYEAQRVEDGAVYLTVDGLRFVMSEPEEPNEEQLQYITSVMESVINVLKSGSREEIEAVIDVDSFTKYYLLNEYVKTFDFDMSSVFYYYRDGKLYAGPAWDYDLSAGNLNDGLNGKRYKEAVPTTGLYIDQKNLYRYLCDKEWFNSAVRSVYLGHYGFFCDINADGGLMDRLYAENQALFDRNYAPDCWKVTKWWINISKPPLATYRENYDYLRDWYRARNRWLTMHFDIARDVLFFGDVDADSDITIIDATVIQRFLADIPTAFPERVQDCGDTDRDGSVTILDATAIQRWLAGLKEIDGIGEPILQ